MPRTRVIGGTRLPVGLCTIEAPPTDSAVEQFFIHLARRCKLSEAAERSGLTLHDVTKRLRTDGAFAARHADALDAAYAMLEWEMLERARFGNPDPKKFNDAHALRMLIRHRGEAGHRRGMKTAVPRERLDTIMTRLLPAIDAFDDDGR